MTLLRSTALSLTCKWKSRPTVVDGPKFALPIGIGGELREALRHTHAEAVSQRAIARHAALAIAQHVGRRNIDEDVILLVESAQPLRVIVQHQRAGIAGGQRIDHILVWHLGVKLTNAAAGDLPEL